MFTRPTLITEHTTIARLSLSETQRKVNSLPIQLAGGEESNAQQPVA